MSFSDNTMTAMIVNKKEGTSTSRENLYRIKICLRNALYKHIMFEEGTEEILYLFRTLQTDVFGTPYVDVLDTSHMDVIRTWQSPTKGFK